MLSWAPILASLQNPAPEREGSRDQVLWKIHTRHDKIAPVGGAEDRDQGPNALGPPPRCACGTRATLRAERCSNRGLLKVRSAMRRREDLTSSPYRLHVTSQLHGVPTLAKPRGLAFRQSFQKSLKFLLREVLENIKGERYG